MNILLADAEIKVANLLCRNLEEIGITVDIAVDGEEVVIKAESTPYDVILMDIILPKVDGLTVIKELRSKNISTPVLCLTAKSTVNDIVAGFNAGCDGYMSKPFALTELVARLRAIDRRSNQQRDTEICVADLRLDLVSHQFWRNGKEIRLGDKEYSFLKFFMRHPNQIISRMMLAEHVWGLLDPFSNMVDVHICFLRNKIETIPGRKILHTVRGSGYILKVG